MKEIAPISIKKLGPRDVDQYRALRLTSYQEAAYAFSESYEDEREKSKEVFLKDITDQGYPEEYFILGAFSLAEELLGFVKFRRDQRSKARHKSMIHAMYVHPEARKTGIGNRLVERLLHICHEMQGLEQIHLWVLYHQGKSAAVFYEKLGFEYQGPLVKKDLKIGDQYIDAGYMVKYL